MLKSAKKGCKCQKVYKKCNIVKKKVQKVFVPFWNQNKYQPSASELKKQQDQITAWPSDNASQTQDKNWVKTSIKI